MCILLLAGEIGPETVLARAPVVSLDIAPGPLMAAMDKFSASTGISIGFKANVTQLKTRGVKGRLSPEEALARLLEGTGLQALRIGDRLYRIEPKPAVIAVRQSPRTPAPTVAPAASEIIVTAQKRPQPLANIPLSVSVLSLDPLGGARSPTSRDISLDMEGLAMTNMGPGRNRQFIRGVADSPFNGLSQSTVAVQVDEARVTFNAPDPDLRLIDVDRIEVLKGPQGPLYGSGALGGIYHIVTRKAELDDSYALARLSAQAVQHGELGTGAEGIMNLPVVDGRLALRAVGYRLLEGGWISNDGSDKATNSTETVGARIALRWQPSERWTVDAGFMLQDINARDSQYVLQSDEMLSRDYPIAEPTDNDFKLWHGTVKGNIGTLELTSATSYVEHGFDYILDASSAADQFGLTGQVRFDDDRRYTVLNQELRIAPQGEQHWLAGLSYLRATTRGEASVTPEGGDPAIVEIYDRQVVEYAIFGEATLPLFNRLDATIGARLFQSITRDGTGDEPRITPVRARKTILSPSAAISYRLNGSGIVYLRYARAMRPGGLAPAETTSARQFDADELSTFDLGFRKTAFDGRWSLSASTYYTLWNDIQSDYLLEDGLVSTRNAGKGRIIGAEIALDWNLGNGFTISAGGSAQSALLTRAADGVKLDDRSLPIAPTFAGRASFGKSFALAGGWQARTGLQANYIGKARLSFDDDLDRSMGNYATASAHAEATRGHWTLSVNMDNLFDIRGDSFSFGNPFAIREEAQYTPIRPRTLTLALARSW